MTHLSDDSTVPSWPVHILRNFILIIFWVLRQPWGSAIHGCQFLCGLPEMIEQTQINIEGKTNGNDLSLFYRG